MKLAVILPSRGLVFSKTVEELLSELKDIDHQIFWSHGRPIPDCFEIPTREALKGNFTHLLVVEEDMILPKGCISKMLEMEMPAVAYDYPVSGDKYGTVLYDEPNSGFFSGTGLLLVEMNIVRRMVFPIWRSDIAWNMKEKNGYIEFTIEKRIGDYGQQDIAFGLRLYANQIPLYIMRETTGQRKLVKRGADKTNQGTHNIVEYDEVNKQMIEQREKIDDIIPIKVGDKVVHLWGPQAEKMIAEGRAKRIRIRNAEFYNTEVLGDWLKLKGE